jgi:protease-4
VGIKGEPEVISPPKKKIDYWDVLVDGMEGKFSGTLRSAAGGMRLMYEVE